MGFWVLAALAAIFIVLVLGYALFAPARAEARASADHDMRVYRDQLAELDRDVARGVLDRAEAERARVEVSRRLLDADQARSQAADTAGPPRSANLVAVGFTSLVMIAGGGWLYASLGAPGYPDYPLALRIELAQMEREDRASQAEAEADLPVWDGPAEDVDPEYATLVAQLRTAVARRPDDPEGLALLARHEAALGNFRSAYLAQQRLVRVQGDASTAREQADLAEFMILAAGGYVSPEAEAALTEALRLDPENGVARYYSGLMFAQTGRPDIAFRLWRRLYENSPADSPWMAPIRAQIGALADAAGVSYSPPAPAPATSPTGPSAEDIEAAADMSAEDRAAMVQGMVDGLAARLAEEGGPAEDWARLIGALGVLGETERATAILNEARGVFADAPEDLARVEAAAQSAGLTE